MKKLSILALLSVVVVAYADPVILTFEQINSGSDLINLTITLDQVVTAEGNFITVKSDVNEGYFGDILAVYIDFNTLPSDLTEEMFSVEAVDNVYSDDGSVVSSTIFNYSPTVYLGENVVTGERSLNINGEIAPFDAGVEIGDDGLGGKKKTDIDPATVFINTTSLISSLTVSDINRVGVRLTSVGVDFDVRNGSTKISYATPETPVPEPAFLTLLGASLLITALVGRKKTAKCRK